MDKLDEVIENYMVDTQDSGCNREQTIRQLFELRKKTIRLIDNTTKTLEKRNNYLAAFDGTVLASGSHKVVGTVVVRTSNLLLASQQKLLESNIIAVLTGNPNDVNSNIGTPSFGSGFEVEDFESWITFPVIGSGGLDVEYFVHYQPKGEFAKYATLNIENFTYTYDDSQDGILKINFAYGGKINKSIIPPKMFL